MGHIIPQSHLPNPLTQMLPVKFSLKCLCGALYFFTESRSSICSKRLRCWSPYQVRQKYLYIVTTTTITTTTPITTITTTTTTYVMRLIADSLLTPSNPYLLIDSSFHRNFRDFVAAIVEFCSGGGRTYWCRVHWRFE